VERLIIFGKFILVFCKAVIPVFYRDSGFFFVFYLVVFLCNPLIAKAEYENEIMLRAKQGDAQAQYALALLYEYGSETISRDKKKSLRLFEQSAKKQVAGACLYIGLKYEHGNGVSQDFEKAICYYLCAANQDWPMAQFFLADFYAEGKGVEKSIPIALAWLGLASEYNYPKAHAELLKLQKQSGKNDLNMLNDIQAKIMIESIKPCN
jgi:TPR repeat protein